MQSRTGHYEQDGGLIYIPIGFVPTYIRMADRVGVAIFYEWWSQMETDEASGSQEGISDTAGTKAALADDGGIVAYDTGTEGPTIEDYTVGRSTAATARTATTPGTFLRPSTTGSAEPSWPTAVGEQVLDNDVRYELVVEPTLRLGYQGVRVAAAIQTDGNEMYYLAIEADNPVDHGDVTGWVDGISPTQ